MVLIDMDASSLNIWVNWPIKVGFEQSHAPCTHNWICGAEIKSMTKVLERVGNGKSEEETELVLVGPGYVSIQNNQG